MCFILYNNQVHSISPLFHPWSYTISSSSIVPILKQKIKLKFREVKKFSQRARIVFQTQFFWLESAHCRKLSLLYKVNIGKRRNQLAKLLYVEAFNAMIITFYLCVSDI